MRPLTAKLLIIFSIALRGEKKWNQQTIALIFKKKWYGIAH
jgi:hypothetical protein